MTDVAARSSTPKAVAYVFNHANVVGGGELSFLDLADAIRDFGVRPIAFVPGPGEVAENLAARNIETVTFPWGSLRGAGLLRAPGQIRDFARRIRDRGVRLVHTNGARCMLYAGPAARRAGIPCLWHVRVLERDRLLDRLRARYATAIVANSRTVAASLVPVAGGTPITTIYNGFRIDELESVPPLDLQGELAVPPAPVVLAVGRFTRWKRFEALIHACRMLRDDGVHFALLLVGAALPDEGAYEAQLRGLTAQLGLADAVFAGWRDDVPAIMKSASAFVLPSLGEPFGRVVVEAWACGAPVVVMPDGGPAEILRNGVDGLLAEGGDPPGIAAALRRILQEPGLAARLSAAGRQRAREFGLAAHASQVASLYEELL